MAWLRDRRWSPIVKALRPELGLLQLAPRPIVENVVQRIVGVQGGWADAGVDEFLRAYLSPRGRAAFYAAARNIYLDEPHGKDGFWTRLEELAPRSLFVWGRQDTLVPIAFMKHVERGAPGGHPSRARVRPRAPARGAARDPRRHPPLLRLTSPPST